MITIAEVEKEFTGEQLQHYFNVAVKGELYKGWYCHTFGCGLAIFIKGDRQIKIVEPEELRGTKDYRWGQWIYLEGLRQIDEIEKV